MKDIPAFPVAYGGGRIEGMTLRDYFAAKAMQGMLAANDVASASALANYSYIIADEMLKAREEK